jgi:large subunit ribosomal protein L21
MYAVVDSGGKQYRVEPGHTLVFDRLDAEAGATVTFDRVLLIADDDGVTVGTPTVAGASVRGTVVAHGRGPKVIVFRFRPKAHYRRRTGHRSALTQVRIDEIATASSRTSAEKSEPKEKAASKAGAKPASVSKAKRASAKTAEPTAKKPAPARRRTATSKEE